MTNGSYISGMGIRKRVDQRHVSALKIDVGVVFYSLGNVFLMACETPVFKSNERVDQSANFPYLPMTIEARGDAEGDAQGGGKKKLLVMHYPPSYRPIKSLRFLGSV